MNSIAARLTAGTIVATLRMLRSARKESFLVVEGDNDIALFSQALSLPRASFVSCFGKDRLMEVFKMAPHIGLDCGTIFLRDADFDGVKHTTIEDVDRYVSDHCDFEMSLLAGRLFPRIASEFLKTRASVEFVIGVFELLLNAAAKIGAFRKYSWDHGLFCKFKDMELKFISRADMSVDMHRMIRYIFARSQIRLRDVNNIMEGVEKVNSTFRPIQLASGKDLLRLLSVALSKQYRCCDAGECTEETLARMLRIATVHDDIRRMTLYPQLSARVASSGFAWMGAPL